MRQSSLDDQGRNGNQPASTNERENLSAKVKYCSNIQDVAGNLSGQLTTVLAIGLHIGFNLSQIQENTDTALLDDQQIGVGASLLLSVVASFIWYRMHRNDTPEEQAKVTQTRKATNVWYRRFKTSMSLGNPLGSSGIEIAFIFLPLPMWLKKPIKIAVANIIGFIFGVIGATFFPDEPDKPNSNKKSVFRLGRDGWSKYAKVGLLPGNSLGAAIGAVIGFLLPIPGGMAAGIAIGTVLGGLIGMIGFTFIVPLINKIAGKNIAGENYRSQYIRTGSLLGVSIGTMVGFIVGFFLPFPGAALLCSTLGAGIGMTIGAITVGILGPLFNKWARGELSDSSPDYGYRTGTMFVNQYGLGSIFSGVIEGLESLFGIKLYSDKSTLKNVINQIGGFIGGIAGSIYDIFHGRKTFKEYKKTFDTEYHKNHIRPANNTEEYDKQYKQALEDAYKNQFKPDFDKKPKPLLSWSDRVRTFITLGGMAGGAIGCLIGSLVGGPIGGVIGFAIGTGIAGIISGVIGAKWGDAIYAKFATFAEKKGLVIETSQKTNTQPNNIPVIPEQSQTNLIREMNKNNDSDSDKENNAPSPVRDNGVITPGSLTPSSSDDSLTNPSSPRPIPKRTVSDSSADHRFFGSQSVSPIDSMDNGILSRSPSFGESESI